MCHPPLLKIYWTIIIALPQIFVELGDLSVYKIEKQTKPKKKKKTKQNIQEL